MTRQKHDYLRQWIRILFSTTVLTLLFYYIDWSQLRTSFLSIQPLSLLLVFLLLIPGFFIRSYRWLILFNTTAVSITLWIAFKILMTGLCLNLILPASLGDVAKSYYGYKWSGIKERMLSISALDKIIAIGSVCLLGLFFAVYEQNRVFGLLSTIGILLSFLFMMLSYLANWKPSQKFIRTLTKWAKNKIDFLEVILQARTTAPRLLSAIALSLVGWLITYFQLYLIMRGMQIEVSIFYVFTIAPFLTLIRMFPFAFQGLGTDELAICFVFHQIGIPYDKSMAAALLYRLFLIIIPGLAGLYFLLETKPKNQFQ